MTDSRSCSRCGAPLVDAAAGAVCPSCLLKLGLGARTEFETVMGTPAPGETMLSGAVEGATVLSTPALSARHSASGARTAPDQIGPYRLVKPLGEGGMGTVYLAEQSEPIRRTVALKLIKLGMDTREVVSRFEAERQALALMDHSNIASVLDAGATSDGRPYFVMEYAPGSPITEYCDAHRLDTRARLALFIQVCGAIQHAHQKGIIHRDLKPSNVLIVEQDGVPIPKVIDFGIAKATDQRLTEQAMFTQHGMLIGTPEYMSPEQADPVGAGDIDTRSDIYSLGVMLYELLVGSVPFPSTQLLEAGYTGLIRIIREVEPAKPSTRLTSQITAVELAERRHTKVPSLTQELRGDLDWITLRALEKDRTRRYPSVSEFAADLTRYLNNEPVVARPPSVGYRVQKFVRRNRLAVTAASLVLLAVVAGLIVSSVLYVREGRAKRDAVAQRAEAVGQRDRADAATLTATAKAESEARQRVVAEAATKAEGEARTAAQRSLAVAETNLYFNNVDLADREIAAGNTSHVDALLAEAPTRLRNWEWHYLSKSAHMEEAAQQTGGEIIAVTLSADGARLLTASRDLTIRQWDTATLKAVGSARRITGPAGSIGGTQIDWSPDRRTIVTRSTVIVPGASAAGAVVGRGAPLGLMGSESLDVWDAATGRRVLHFDSRTFGVAYPWFFFSADSSRLTVVAEDRTAAFEAMNRGQQPSPPPTKLTTWDVRTGGEAPTHWGRDNTVPPGALRIAVSGDGRRLAVAAGREVACFDAETGEKQVALANSPGVVRIAFSADGRTVAGVKSVSGSTKGSLVVWNATDGSESLVFPLDSIFPLFAISPDGRWLAVSRSDRSIQVINVEGKREVQRVSGSTTTITGLTFSLDGRRILAGEAGGHVRVWLIPASTTAMVLDAGTNAVVTAGLFSRVPAIVATVMERGTTHAFMWETNSGRSMATPWPLAQNAASTLTMSADGRRAAVLTGTRAMVFDTASGSTVGTIVPTAAAFKGASGDLGPPKLTLSPHGDRLAVIGNGFGRSSSGELQMGTGHLEVFDLGSGRVIYSHDYPEALVAAVRFSDAGSALAVVVGGVGLTRVEVNDLAPGRVRVAIPDATDPAFSPDGRYVAAVTKGYSVVVADRQTGSVRPLLPPQSVPVIGIAFNRDNTRLATAQSDGTVKVWETGAGRQVAVLRASTGAAVVREWIVTGRAQVANSTHAVAFSADGTRIVLTTVAGDTRGKLIRTTTWTGAVTR